MPRSLRAVRPVQGRARCTWRGARWSSRFARPPDWSMRATLDSETLPVAVPPAVLIVPHHGPVIKAPPDLATGPAGGAQRPVDRPRGQHAGQQGVLRAQHGDRRRCRDAGAQRLRDRRAELRARRRPGQHRLLPARARAGPRVRRCSAHRTGQAASRRGFHSPATARPSGARRAPTAEAAAGVPRRAGSPTISCRQGSPQGKNPRQGLLLHRQRRSDVAARQPGEGRVRRQQPARRTRRT